MTTLNQYYPTLIDTARNQNNKKIIRLVELLNKKNYILEDMVVIAGNDGTGHKTQMRAALPTPVFREYYGGVTPTKGAIVTVRDKCAQIASLSRVDADLIDHSENPGEKRMQEAKSHLMSINNRMATALFYGNSKTDPEQFLGLAPRFSDTTAVSGSQILNAAGTGSDNTSIWLVCWGVESVHAFYPQDASGGKGSADDVDVTEGLGIKHEKFAKQLRPVPVGTGEFPAYDDWFSWTLGLAVPDYRQVCRIANIDVSDLTADASGSSADIIDLMIQAMHTVDDLDVGRPVFYCNRTIHSILDRQTLNRTQMNISYQNDPYGKQLLTFRGIPIRRCDAILDTEEAVS